MIWIYQIFKLESEESLKNTSHFFWRDRFVFFLYFSYKRIIQIHQIFKKLQKYKPSLLRKHSNKLLFILYLSRIFIHKRIVDPTSNFQKSFKKQIKTYEPSLVKRTQMNLVLQMRQNSNFDFSRKRKKKYDSRCYRQISIRIILWNTIFFFPFFSGWSRNNLTFASRHE